MKMNWIKMPTGFFSRFDINTILNKYNGEKAIILYLSLVTNNLFQTQNGKAKMQFARAIANFDCKLADEETTEALQLLQEYNLVSIVGDELNINQAKAIFNIGEIDHNKDWSKTRRERFGGNYYEVRARDKDRCILCGSIANLAVHHLIPYDETYPITTKKENLITVCEECHSMLHNSSKVKWFGVLPPQDILDKVGFNNTMLDFYSQLYLEDGDEEELESMDPSLKIYQTRQLVELPKKEQDNGNI